MTPLASHKLRECSRAQLVALPVAGASRRPHWLNSTRLCVYSVVALIGYLAFFAMYLYRVFWQQRVGISPLAMDFLPFWSASFLALHGHALDAYNVNALSAVEIAAVPYFHTTDSILPWLYPPNSLLLISPLALLPYKAAAVTFIGGTLALFAKAIHRIVAHRQTVFVTFAFPGVALVAVVGQNGLLTAALAAFGLLALRRHPLAAGICFGLLCVKPHLALLFPFALVCSRSWRALASFTLTVVLTLALAGLVFGTGTFAAFLHNADMAAGFVESGRAALARMPTAFALMKLAHAANAPAYAAQGISALLAVVAVWYTWRDECSHALRAATLICASLLVSPYLYDYDLAWYGVLVAWYCRYGLARGWTRWEREWLIVLWLAPLAGMVVITRVPFQFLPLLSLITLGMLVRRVALERHSAPLFPPAPDSREIHHETQAASSDVGAPPRSDSNVTVLRQPSSLP